MYGYARHGSAAMIQELSLKVKWSHAIIRNRSDEDGPCQAFIGNGAAESSWTACWKSLEIVDNLNTVQG